MVFLAKSTQQIAEDALLVLQETTNITRLSPGGKARSILDIVSQVQRESYQEIDLGLAKAFLSAASGQFLDLFGVLLGEPRLPSVAAVAEAEMQTVKFFVDSGTFGDINGGEDILPERGTIISTKTGGEGITFRLVVDLTLSASSNLAWASVEATNPGSDYNVGANALIHHDFEDYSNYLNETLKVTNVHAVGSGKDFENDTNYRYRLSNKITDAEAGNEIALRLAALSVPGVADVLMKQHYRGIGTWGIIIKSIAPTASLSLIENARERILKKASFGSVDFVRGQKETGFSMKTRVWYRKKLSDDEHDDIEDAMEDIIINHVDNLDLGESLFLDRLISELYDVSTAIEGFGTRINPIDEAWIYFPTELEDNRIPRRLIGDYSPLSDEERVIIESSISSPITFERKFGSRPSK